MCRYAYHSFFAAFNPDCQFGNRTSSIVGDRLSNTLPDDSRWIFSNEVNFNCHKFVKWRHKVQIVRRKDIDYSMYKLQKLSCGTRRERERESERKRELCVKSWVREREAEREKDMTRRRRKSSVCRKSKRECVRERSSEPGYT